MKNVDANKTLLYFRRLSSRRGGRWCLRRRKTLFLLSSCNKHKVADSLELFIAKSFAFLCEGEYNCSSFKITFKHGRSFRLWRKNLLCSIIAHIVPACESDAHMNQKRHFLLIWTKILFVGLAKDNQGF